MKFATILAAACAFVSGSLSEARYSESTAKYYVDFAGASYCAGTLGQGVENWDCHVCANHPGVNATTVYKSGTNANGFVAYVPERNQVMVAFAGTDPLSIKNWIDDIDTLMTGYGACSGCEIHEGFLRTYNSVVGQVRSVVKDYTSAHPGASVTVTGHSLGAALAMIAVMDLSQQGYNVAETYTFGLPRVGNDALRKYYETLVSDTFRVTHHRDPVPHLPMESWGFHHPATEVFYESSSPAVCNGSGEDPDCSDKYYLDVDVTDHLEYVDFDFTTNYLYCKL